MKQTPGETRHVVARCQEDDRFRRWFETLELENENTAAEYAKVVVRLTRSVGSDPLTYDRLHHEDRDRFDDVTQDILNGMIRRGLDAKRTGSGSSRG